MSAKKKKRMDNYIDKKLKKERRGEIFKSLACVRPKQGNFQLLCTYTELSVYAIQCVAKDNDRHFEASAIFDTWFKAVQVEPG